MSVETAPPAVPQSRPDRKKALAAVGLAVVVGVVVFGVIFPQLVDWDSVFEAIGSIDPIDLALLVALGLLRYLPSGWLYSIVLPGMSVKNGTQAWVATTGVGSTLPGFDLVLRIGMYSSWGFPLDKAAAGMVLSGIVEMSTKVVLAVLAVGIWGLATLDVGLLAIVGIAALVVVVLGAAVAAVLRSADTAERFGRRVDQVSRWSFDKLSRPAPEDLIDRILEIRTEARDVLGHRWPKAFLAAFLAQATVFALLLVALRSVGVSDEVVDWTQILLVHALVTIITSIPITPGGVGISELAYLGLFAPMVDQAELVPIAAGIVLYRLALWLLSIVVGWAVTLRWQSRTGVRLLGGAASTGEPDTGSDIERRSV